MIAVPFLLCGGMAAFMAHRGLLIYHDALRTYAHDSVEGRLSRRDWFFKSLPLSVGLLLGFGLPFSLVSHIVLAHLLFIGTDLIGALVPSFITKRVDKTFIGASWIASIVAAVGGIAYASLLYFGLGSLVQWMYRFPIPLAQAAKLIGGPIILLFSFFPLFVIYRQFGVKRGIFSIVVVLLTLLVTYVFEWHPSLPLMTVVTFIGIGLLVLFILTEKKGKSTTSIIPMFAHKVRRLRLSVIGVFMMGALYAASIHSGMLAEGPQSLFAMATAEMDDAATVAFARALSFIPLKGMTSLMSGVFPTDGFGFAAVAGIIAKSFWLALLSGGVVMTVEVLLLVRVAKALDALPVVRETAEHIRNTMTELLGIGMLIGSFIAAVRIGGEWGALIVISFHVLNGYAGHRIPKVSVGLIGFLVTFLLVNMFEIFM